MSFRPVVPIVRALRLALLVTGLSAASACSGNLLGGQPTLTPTRTPTRTPRRTPTLSPTLPSTNTPEPPPPETPTVPPTPDVHATASTRSATCEHYVAAISGAEKDSPLLENPEVQVLAEIPDLAICGAVVRDSDAVCKRLYATNQILAHVCIRMRDMFHELRAYPNRRSFMFDDVDLQACRKLAVLPPKACDAMRDALRSGDATKCAQTGDGQSICRAYLSLDTSLCRAEGKLAQAKGVGNDKQPAKSVIEDRCRQQIETRAVLAKGLKELAQSGPELERALARAALGQADACASFAKATKDRCAQQSQTQASGTPASATPVPTSTLSSWIQDWSR